MTKTNGPAIQQTEIRVHRAEVSLPKFKSLHIKNRILDTLKKIYICKCINKIKEKSGKKNLESFRITQC